MARRDKLATMRSNMSPLTANKRLSAFLKKRTHNEIIAGMSLIVLFGTAFGISVIMQTIGFPSFLSWPILFGLIISMVLNPELLAFSVTQTAKFLRDHDLIKFHLSVERIDMKRFQIDKLTFDSQLVTLSVQQIALRLSVGAGPPLKLTIENARVSHTVGKVPIAPRKGMKQSKRQSIEEKQHVVNLMLWVSRFISIHLKQVDIEASFTVNESDRKKSNPLRRSCNVRMVDMVFSVTNVAGVTNSPLGFASLFGYTETAIPKKLSPSMALEDSMGSQLSASVSEIDVVACSYTKNEVYRDKVMYCRSFTSSFQVQEKKEVHDEMSLFHLPEQADGATHALELPIVPCLMNVNVSSIGINVCPRSVEALAMLDIALQGPQQWHRQYHSNEVDFTTQDCEDGSSSDEEISGDIASSNTSRPVRTDTEDSGWECKECSYLNTQGSYECQVCHIPSGQTRPSDDVTESEKDPDPEATSPLRSPSQMFRPASRLALRQNQIRKLFSGVKSMPFVTKINVDTCSIDVSTYSHNPSKNHSDESSEEKHATLSLVTSLGITVHSSQTPLLLPESRRKSNTRSWGTRAPRSDSTNSAYSSRSEATCDGSDTESPTGKASVMVVSFSFRATDPLLSIKPTREATLTPFRVLSSDSFSIRVGLSVVCRGDRSGVRCNEDTMSNSVELNENYERYQYHHHTQLNAESFAEEFEFRYKPEAVEAGATLLYSMANTFDASAVSRRKVAATMLKHNFGSKSFVPRQSHGHHVQFNPDWLVTKGGSVNCHVRRGLAKVSPTHRKLPYDTCFRQLDTDELQSYRMLLSAGSISFGAELNNLSPAETTPPHNRSEDSQTHFTTIGADSKQLQLENWSSDVGDEWQVTERQLLEWAHSSKYNASQLYLVNADSLSDGNGSIAPAPIISLHCNLTDLETSLSSSVPGYSSSTGRRDYGGMRLEQVLILPGFQVNITSARPQNGILNLPSSERETEDSNSDTVARDTGLEALRNSEATSLKCTLLLCKLEAHLSAISVFRSLKLLEDITMNFNQILKPAISRQAVALEDMHHRRQHNTFPESSFGSPRSSFSSTDNNTPQFRLTHVQAQITEAKFVTHLGNSMDFTFYLPRTQLLGSQVDNVDGEPEIHSNVKLSDLNVDIMHGSRKHLKVLSIGSASGEVSRFRDFSVEVCAVKVHVDENIEFGTIIQRTLEEQKACELLLKLLPRLSSDQAFDATNFFERAKVETSEQHLRSKGIRNQNNSTQAVVSQRDIQIRFQDILIQFDAALGRNEAIEHKTNHVLSVQVEEFSVRALWDKASCSKQELVKVIRVLDDKNVPPEVYSHGFSFVQGCKLENLSLRGLTTSVRDFEPVVQLANFHTLGATAVIASLTGTRACTRETPIELGSQTQYTVKIKQTGVPIKLYWDCRSMQLDALRVVHGDFLTPSLISISEMMDRVLPSSSDKVSPKLFWWDKIRYQVHGNFTLAISNLSIEVPCSPPWIERHQRIAVTASVANLSPVAIVEGKQEDDFVRPPNPLLLGQRFVINMSDVEVLLLVHGLPESIITHSPNTSNDDESDSWPQGNRWSPMSANSKAAGSTDAVAIVASNEKLPKSPSRALKVFEFLLLQLPHCEWEWMVEWKGISSNQHDPAIELHSKKELMYYLHNHYVQLHHSYATDPEEVSDLYRLFRSHGVSVYQRLTISGHLESFPTLFSCWTAYAYFQQFINDRLATSTQAPESTDGNPNLLRFLDQFDITMAIDSPRVLWWESAHAEAAVLVYADKLSIQWECSRPRTVAQKQSNWPMVIHRGIVVECPSFAGHFVERIHDVDFETSDTINMVLDGTGCGGDPWASFDPPPWLSGNDFDLNKVEQKHEPFIIVPCILFTQGDWLRLVPNPKVFLGGPGGDDELKTGRPHIVMDELKLTWNVSVRDALFMVVGSIYYGIENMRVPSAVQAVDETKATEETDNRSVISNVASNARSDASDDEGNTRNSNWLESWDGVVSDGSQSPRKQPPPLPPRPPDEVRRQSISSLRKDFLADTSLDIPEVDGKRLQSLGEMSMDPDLSLGVSILVDLRWAQVKLSAGNSMMLVAGQHTCIRVLKGQSEKQLFATGASASSIGGTNVSSETWEEELGCVLQKQVHVEVQGTHVFAAPRDVDVNNRFQWVPGMRPSDAAFCVPIQQDSDETVASSNVQDDGESDEHPPAIPSRPSDNNRLDGNESNLDDVEMQSLLEGSDEQLSWESSKLRLLMIGEVVEEQKVESGSGDNSNIDGFGVLKCVLRGADFKFVDMTKGWVFDNPDVESEPPAQSLHVDIPILDVRLSSQEFFVVLGVVRDLLLVAPPPDYKFLVQSQQQGRRGGMNAAWDPDDIANASAKLNKAGRDMKLLRSIVEEFQAKLRRNESTKVKSIKYRVGDGTLTLLGDNPAAPEPGAGRVLSDRFERVQVVVKGIEGNHSFMDDGGTSVHVEVQLLELVDCSPGWQAMQFDDGEDAQQVLRGQRLDDFSHTPMLDTPIFTLDAVTSAPLLIGGFSVTTYEFLQFHIFPAANYQLNVRLTQSVASFLTRYFATDDESDTPQVSSEKDERVRGGMKKMGLMFTGGTRRLKTDSSPPTPSSKNTNSNPELPGAIGAPSLKLPPSVVQVDNNGNDVTFPDTPTAAGGSPTFGASLQALKVDTQNSIPQLSSKIKRTLYSLSTNRSGSVSPPQRRFPAGKPNIESEEHAMESKTSLNSVVNHNQDNNTSPHSAPGTGGPAEEDNSDDGSGDDDEFIKHVFTSGSRTRRRSKGGGDGSRGSLEPTSRHRRTVSADGVLSNPLLLKSSNFEGPDSPVEEGTSNSIGTPRGPVGFHGAKTGKGKDVIYMGWVSKRTKHFTKWSGGRVRKNLVLLRVKNPSLPITTKSLIAAVVLEYYRSELEIKLKIPPRGSFSLQDVVKVCFTSDASAPRHALDIVVRVPNDASSTSDPKSAEHGLNNEGSDVDQAGVTNVECTFTFLVEPSGTGQGYEEAALDFVAQLYGLVPSGSIAREVMDAIRSSKRQFERLESIVAATRAAIEDRLNRLRVTSSEPKVGENVNGSGKGTGKQYQVTARRQTEFGDNTDESLEPIVYFKYARVGDIRLLLSCQGFPLNVNRRIASCPALDFNSRLWTWNQFFRRLRRRMVLKLIPSILKWQKQKTTNRLGTLQESISTAASRRIRAADSSVVAGPLMKGVGRIRGKLMGRFRKPANSGPSTPTSQESQTAESRANVSGTDHTVDEEVFVPNPEAIDATHTTIHDDESDIHDEETDAGIIVADEAAIQAMFGASANIVEDDLDLEDAHELLAAGIDVNYLYQSGDKGEQITLSGLGEVNNPGDLSPKKSIMGIATAAISAGNRFLANHSRNNTSSTLEHGDEAHEENGNVEVQQSPNDKLESDNPVQKEE